MPTNTSFPPQKSYANVFRNQQTFEQRKLDATLKQMKEAIRAAQIMILQMRKMLEAFSKITHQNTETQEQHHHPTSFKLGSEDEI